MNITTNKTIIRDADADDAAKILMLVKELAIYENAEDQVTASLQSYREHLKEGKIYCKLAEVDGTIVGMALYYETFSTWKGRMYYLEDFIVTEKYRRKGIGKLLINSYLKAAADGGAVLAKWQVLNWNKPAISFYQKMGATIEKDWWNVKLQLHTKS